MSSVQRYNFYSQNEPLKTIVGKVGTVCKINEPGLVDNYPLLKKGSIYIFQNGQFGGSHQGWQQYPLVIWSPACSFPALFEHCDA